MVLFLPQPGFPGLEIKGWKREWHHSLLAPGKTPAKFLLPVPVILYSAGPEVLVPEGGLHSPGATLILLS